MGVSVEFAVGRSVGNTFPLVRSIEVSRGVSAVGLQFLTRRTYLQHCSYGFHLYFVLVIRLFWLWLPISGNKEAEVSSKSNSSIRLIV
jgi:hypothetical protein